MCRTQTVLCAHPMTEWFDCRAGPVSGLWVCPQASLSCAAPGDRKVLEVLQSHGNRGKGAACAALLRSTECETNYPGGCDQ